MLFLFLAVISSFLVAVTIKFFEQFNVNSFQAIVINYIICIVAGFVAYSENINFNFIASQSWFYFAVLLGFGFIFMFYVFAVSTARIGIALTTVSSKMSVIIPVFFGIILFNDNFNIYKVFGIIFTILAIYLIFKKDKNIPFRKVYFLLPLLLLIGNGFNDTMQTYCRRTFFMDNNTILLFMMVIYSSAFCIGILIFAFRRFVDNSAITFNTLIAGIVLGIFNFTATFFFLKSIGHFESTFVFPVFNVSIVSISALAGVILFKEKLKPVNWIGIALAVIAIIVIALG